MWPEPLGQDLGDVLVRLGVGLSRRAGLDGNLLLDTVLVRSGDRPQDLGQPPGLAAVVGGLPNQEGLVVALELGHEAVLLRLFLVGGATGPVVVPALGPSGRLVVQALAGPGQQLGHAVHPPLLAEGGALEGRLGTLVVRPPSQLGPLEGLADAGPDRQTRHHRRPLDLELDTRLEQLVGGVRPTGGQTAAATAAEAGLGRGAVRDGGDTIITGSRCGRGRHRSRSRGGLEQGRMGQPRPPLADRLDDTAGTTAARTTKTAAAADPTAVGTEGGRRLLLAPRQHVVMQCSGTAAGILLIPPRARYVMTRRLD
mmetsp:Transcript_24735/g.71414  ORF Transcript_24735/g.71414 Transcript_24735/m.71414 type:complete len:312 (+) Transcript_24735:1354-2289(+)